METRFGEILRRAQETGRSVGAFTCYDLLGFEAVVRAAESYRAPVIILVSPSSFGARGGGRLVRAFGAAAKTSSVEVLVQLDHAGDERLIERAADCGVEAAMADGSKLPFAENLAFARSVVRSMRPRGVGVEAELGRVEGHEDEAGETLSGATTEPGDAEEFVKQSGVDCLAVAMVNLESLGDGVVAAVQEVVEAKLSAFGWTREEA